VCRFGTAAVGSAPKRRCSRDVGLGVRGPEGARLLDGEGGCAGGSGRRSALVWKVALDGWDHRRDQDRTIGDPHRSGGHCMWNKDRGDSVRLLRQDDSVPVVVGRDKLDDIISRHPVTMRRKAGSQCSEDEEQEAGQQPLG